MAYNGTFTTTTQIWAKMGIGGNTTDFTTDMMNDSAIAAESIINSASRYNWTATFDTLTTASSGILSDAAASLIAIDGIGFDFTGYPSRIVAEDKINVLRDASLRDISILRDSKTKSFILDPDADRGVA